MERSELIKMARICEGSYRTCKQCSFYEEPVYKCKVKLIQALADALEDAVRNAEVVSE